MINWICNNWDVILIIIGLFFLIVYGIMTGKVKHWLRYAVCLAEQDLGSGTGQLKLHKVYDMFIEKFPGFVTIVPFALFSYWVDNALDWMKEQLEKNPDIKQTIVGESNDSSTN